MSIMRKIFPQKKEKPVNWDAFSKPADVWNGVSEAIDKDSGLTVSEKAARDKADQAAKEEAEKAAERLRKIAEDQQLLKDEATRPEREAAEKIRHEIAEKAEKARLRDRAQALVIEAEQREDQERRSAYTLKDKETEAKNIQADIVIAREKENQKQSSKGALMRAFAASAQRAFKATIPVAGTLLLLSAMIFGIRIATIPLDGFCPNKNGDVGARRDDNKKYDPAPPTDNSSDGAKPDGHGIPDNPDPSKWGWEKYFKANGQPIQSAQTVAPAAPRR